MPVTVNCTPVAPAATVAGRTFVIVGDGSENCVSANCPSRFTIRNLCAPGLNIVAALLLSTVTRSSEQKVRSLAPTCGAHSTSVILPSGPRSEERRVGKEFRSRWAPEPYRKKDETDSEL